MNKVSIPGRSGTSNILQLNLNHSIRTPVFNTKAAEPLPKDQQDDSKKQLSDFSLFNSHKQ